MTLNHAIRLPRRPSILLITNHVDDDGCAGQIDGLKLLVETGELASVDVVHAAGNAPAAVNDHRVIQAVGASRADMILALSIKRLIRDMEGVQRVLAGRPMIFWEGDLWGRGKPVSDEMTAWLEMSEVVFSVGGVLQRELLASHGAREVIATTNTYDHILFAGSEVAPPPDQYPFEACLIGSNLMRVPLVTGLPGSYQRFALVRGLRKRFGGRFQLAGHGWPANWSVGSVPYAQQDSFIRSARILVSWDHYPGVRSSSDRLPIAMIAGRPQVTTAHTSMTWLPGPDQGLFVEQSPAAVLSRVDELAGNPDAYEAGLAAHAWAKHRLSHREAMRFMISSVVEDVEPAPSTPWAELT